MLTCWYTKYGQLCEGKTTYLCLGRTWCLVGDTAVTECKACPILLAVELKYEALRDDDANWFRQSAVWSSQMQRCNEQETNRQYSVPNAKVHLTLCQTGPPVFTRDEHLMKQKPSLCRTEPPCLYTVRQTTCEWHIYVGMNQRQAY